MGIQRENKIRKFDWRIVKKLRFKRYSPNETEVFYEVQRRTSFFGIKFWWTSHWQMYNFDAVNHNEMKHNSYELAYLQMSEQILNISYLYRKKIIVADKYYCLKEEIEEKGLRKLEEELKKKPVTKGIIPIKKNLPS